MKVFGHPYGYKFFINNSDWRELSKEEKAKFKLGKHYLTYLVNPKLGKEFCVVLDGFYKNDNLQVFYKACKKVFKDNKYTVEAEENCEFINPKNEKINCIKAFVKKPDGLYQTSFFMKLTGKTARGVGLGCVSTFSQKLGDENEDIIKEALSNWEYFDAK